MVSEGSREWWADLVGTVEGTGRVLLGSSGKLLLEGVTQHIAVGTEACRPSRTPTPLRLALMADASFAPLFSVISFIIIRWLL